MIASSVRSCVRSRVSSSISRLLTRSYWNGSSSVKDSYQGSVAASEAAEMILMHRLTQMQPHQLPIYRALDPSQLPTAFIQPSATPSISSLHATSSALPAELEDDLPVRHNPFAYLKYQRGLLADSTKRKRAKKMNKHKWKKRLKEQRRRSRKDLAQ